MLRIYIYIAKLLPSSQVAPLTQTSPLSASNTQFGDNVSNTWTLGVPLISQQLVIRFLEFLLRKVHACLTATSHGLSSRRGMEMQPSEESPETTSLCLGLQAYQDIQA